ncbi:TIGR02450 family Trp-rich protein [Methylicorpusculum sp.]|uniref:TIGR02450 family Trp-rich protein n=2 Tax=Methylicorpusculum sp. TaxID=2713644 RepID=UPI00272F2A80|nr:TIGR02450 family Trp-rich protein [Methylicorpusculum sp.]MDP2180032.1 TIGR02450 family Trp-rich protein [Methylicorpusculum sp.]MDP3530412.1 TIGR02450 family Trp-rich protein [Methylicorpusculum sp.]
MINIRKHNDFKAMLTSTSRINPRKLLLSKWTAASPRNKEKHFIVTQLIEPEPPEIKIELIELEAVYSRRSVILPWRELTDASQWLQGWK